jgi:hypothetical protein
MQPTGLPSISATTDYVPSIIGHFGATVPGTSNAYIVQGNKVPIPWCEATPDYRAKLKIGDEGRDRLRPHDPQRDARHRLDKDG